MAMRYTPAVQTAGEGVMSCANTIRQIGDDMYSHLRTLIGSEALSGEGIAQALESSQQRWNAACGEFAQAEQDFGSRTVDAYVNMMAADQRGAGFFPT